MERVTGIGRRDPQKMLAKFLKKKTVDANGSPILGSVCIAMVRNEQDIIEPFLRHNAKFFDLMFILDNRSTDATREIIAACVRELGNICVSDLPREDYAQSEFMTNAMHAVQAGCFADFIGFLDADEFIDAPDRASLDSALSKIPVGAYGTLQWKTVLPAPDSDAIDCLDRLQWQRKVEKPPYYKGIFRAGGRVTADVNVA